MVGELFILCRADRLIEGCCAGEVADRQIDEDQFGHGSFLSAGFDRRTNERVLIRQPIWIFHVADMTGLSDVIPGWPKDQTPDVQLHIMVRCCASPRNDGLD